MKFRWITFLVLVAGFGLAGCATTAEPTQKEKDRMAREMERENRRQTQAQEKMMRTNNRSNPSGLGGQRTGSR